MGVRWTVHVHVRASVRCAAVTLCSAAVVGFDAGWHSLSLVFLCVALAGLSASPILSL